MKTCWIVTSWWPLRVDTCNTSYNVLGISVLESGDCITTQVIVVGEKPQECELENLNLWHYAPLPSCLPFSFLLMVS
jgi:hypothetical protein